MKETSADTNAPEPWWINGDRERLVQMRNACNKKPETAMVRYCGDMRPMLCSEVRALAYQLQARIEIDIANFRSAGGDYQKMP